MPRRDLLGKVQLQDGRLPNSILHTGELQPNQLVNGRCHLQRVDQSDKIVHYRAPALFQSIADSITARHSCRRRKITAITSHGKNAHRRTSAGLVPRNLGVNRRITKRRAASGTYRDLP